MAREAATGKAYIHTHTDRYGRPVMVVRAHKHITGGWRWWSGGVICVGVLRGMGVGGWVAGGGGGERVPTGVSWVLLVRVHKHIIGGCCLFQPQGRLGREGYLKVVCVVCIRMLILVAHAQVCVCNAYCALAPLITCVFTSL